MTCVVPHEGVRSTRSSFVTFLRKRLASYKVPRRVLFFREDEFAMTGSARSRPGACGSWPPSGCSGN